MRRLLYLFFVYMLATGLLTPPAFGQVPVSCDVFLPAAGYRSQWGAQQFFDFNATPEQRALLDTDGDGFACDGWSSGADTLGIWGGESGYWGLDGYYYYY